MVDETTMTKYGKGRTKKKRASQESVDIVRPEVDEYRPYNELCRFADECKLQIEIDKPFPELDQMFLKVTDKEGTILKKIVLDSIEALDEESAKVLNDLGKKFK